MFTPGAELPNIRANIVANMSTTELEVIDQVILEIENVRHWEKTEAVYFKLNNNTLREACVAKGDAKGKVYLTTIDDLKCSLWIGVFHSFNRQGSLMWISPSKLFCTVVTKYKYIIEISSLQGAAVWFGRRDFVHTYYIIICSKCWQFI